MKHVSAILLLSIIAVFYYGCSTSPTDPSTRNTSTSESNQNINIDNVKVRKPIFHAHFKNEPSQREIDSIDMIASKIINKTRTTWFRIRVLTASDRYSDNDSPEDVFIWGGGYTFCMQTVGKDNLERGEIDYYYYVDVYPDFQQIRLQNSSTDGWRCENVQTWNYYYSIHREWFDGSFDVWVDYPNYEYSPWYNCDY